MWVKKEVLEKIIERLENIEKFVIKNQLQYEALNDKIDQHLADFKKTVMPVFNLPKKKFKPKDKELYDEEMKENTNYAIG